MTFAAEKLAGASAKAFNERKRAAKTVMKMRVISAGHIEHKRTRIVRIEKDLRSCGSLIMDGQVPRMGEVGCGIV